MDLAFGIQAGVVRRHPLANEQACTRKVFSYNEEQFLFGKRLSSDSSYKV